MRGAFDNLSKIREATGILCLDELSHIEARINRYAKAHYLTFSEAFSVLMKQVWEEDIREAFDKYCKTHGNIITIDDRGQPSKWKMIAPRNFDKNSGGRKKEPVRLNVATVSRFGSYAPSRNIDFPVSADLQFWIELKGVDDNGNIKKYYSRAVCMSYNELMGYTDSGHKLPWSHKKAFHSDAPSNEPQATMYYSNWLSDPLYRVTPCGQPKVNELLSAGSIVEVETRFDDNKHRYVVKDIIKRTYSPIERKGEHFEYFDLTLCTKAENGEYEEVCAPYRNLVSVNGELLQLFATSCDDEKIKEVGFDEDFVAWLKKNGEKTDAGLFGDTEEEWDTCCNTSCNTAPSPPKSKDAASCAGLTVEPKQTNIFDFL